MKTKKTTITMSKLKSDDGLIGNPNGTDVQSEGFKRLKQAIVERSSSLSYEQKIEIELRAVRYQMQSYLIQNTEEVISTGNFLRIFLKVTGVQLKSFATYMDSNSGNVSKIINGHRKISPETAIILGKTFNMDPELWLQVQDKNEVIELRRINKTQYRRYSLEHLMKVKSATK